MSATVSGAHMVWDLEAQDPASFGEQNEFQVDYAVVSRLMFSVDYAWISHTFAATFLAICYVRGAIDGEDQRCVSLTKQRICGSLPLLKLKLFRLVPPVHFRCCLAS